MTATAEAWAEARAAFEAGESARTVSARLGVAHTTVTRRARREGWAVPSDAPPAPPVARRVPARPDAPAGASPALVERLAIDAAPDPLDPSTPEGQRAIMRAVGQRSGPELEDWLEDEAEYLREQRAERQGLRGLGWIRRAGF